MIKLVTAVDEDGLIGVDNGLPWKISEELENFRELTHGEVLVMGRKTFESIGKALPGRITVVLTSDPKWSHTDALTASSVDEILEKYSDFMVVGGEQVYESFIPFADELIITKIEDGKKYVGDSYFPIYDPDDYRDEIIKESKDFTVHRLVNKKFTGRRKYGRGKFVGLTSFKHSNQWIFGTMLVSALVSLLAAFVLSRDAIILASDPGASLSCNINAVISCGTVGSSWQASLLGFPNAFFGLMTEPVVITIAVAGLSGIAFKRWFMFTAQVVYLVGLIFAYWLFYQSAFVIHALCPWCFLVTISTTFVFFTLLGYNIRENNLYLPSSVQAKLEKFSRYGGDTIFAVSIVLIILSIVFFKYGSYIF